MKKRSPKTASGQFTLALRRESSEFLDEARKEEVLKALADLMLEALGAESREDQSEKEASDESEDHA
ncbi:MAG: hypothetical protein WCO84_05775 [bacterium]|jgi:hypothetical protein